MLIEEKLTEKVIGSLIEVHRYWGPGLYEEIYERSMYRELEVQSIQHVSQLHLPLVYKGFQVGDDLRLDLLVENKLVVEMKVVKQLLPIHESQLLTYMRLTGCRVGLLVNFNVPVLKDGLKRFVL